MKFVSTSPEELDEKYYQWFAFGSFAYCPISQLGRFPVQNRSLVQVHNPSIRLDACMYEIANPFSSNQAEGFGFSSGEEQGLL